MKPSDFYTELPYQIESDFINEVNNFIDTSGYRTTTERISQLGVYVTAAFGEEFWKNYHNKAGDARCREISMLLLPEKIYRKYMLGQLVTKLSSKYGPVIPYIFKVPENYYVSWHQDAARTVGLNIPLTDKYDSVTAYSNVINEEDLEKCFRMIKVDYELHKSYLLNLTRYHCVMNYSDQPRFIIMVLWNSGEDNYFDIKEWL